MTATATRKWPETFGTATVKAIEEARRIYPDLAKWPEEAKYLEAGQAAAMAAALVEQAHTELANAEVCYLFREKLGGRNETRWGKTSKASALIKHVAGFDFILEINFTVWNRLGLVRRAALLDHLLEHCGRDDNGNFITLSPEVSEFGAIVKRWGRWQPSLAVFLTAADTGPQLDMLEEGKG